MPTLSQPRYAGILAENRGRVVLVREEYPRWAGSYWNIPSGRVEDTETPGQGACRELAEETGLIVAVADLVLVATSSVASPEKVSRAWTFTVEVHDPTLEVQDPDGLIQDARWFPVHEAGRLLQSLPYRPLREPAVALLSHHVQPGGHWAYSDPEAEPVLTFPSS
jgi:ADP-ribose pyrophosphatase YjhB (NUDIX family)